MNTLRNEKIEELKDRESRQFFYEEHIETGLPIQIRELRKKRKLTQKELAKLAECDQSNVSDWENPNYEYTPQIGTLKRLANAFDVPLIVRFGSWEELLTWDSDLSSKKIAPEKFDDAIEELEQSAKPNGDNDSISVIQPTVVTKSKFRVITGKDIPTAQQPLFKPYGVQSSNKQRGKSQLPPDKRTVAKEVQIEDSAYQNNENRLSRAAGSTR
ncbi:MAG: helix-turn-helix transcriptional regulator [Acidobacteria bacterium]|nr:helix-turn-helix transcriptional regulator [Acidobacteriota bacterium]MCA1639525.1 helix-turn-helix transcriptional regulator [Acidobacteriota bacterium]